MYKIERNRYASYIHNPSRNRDTINTSVTLKDGVRLVRGRAAEREERQRLWEGFRAYVSSGDIDAYARLRPTETAVVVLEPQGGRSPT